jgi:hypothetical protein
MKYLYKTEKTWRQLFDDALIIICICGSVAAALKFVTYFNHWMFFPAFPNALDSVLIIFSSVYLAVCLLKYKKCATADEDGFSFLIDLENSR